MGHSPWVPRAVQRETAESSAFRHLRPLLWMRAAGLAAPGPRWCPFPQPERAFEAVSRGAGASPAPRSPTAGPQPSASSPRAEGLTI